MTTIISIKSAFLLIRFTSGIHTIEKGNKSINTASKKSRKIDKLSEKSHGAENNSPESEHEPCSVLASTTDSSHWGRVTGHCEWKSDNVRCHSWCNPHGANWKQTELRQ